MKFIITGKHCSGKLEVLRLLGELGMNIGHEFSNIPRYNPSIYIDPEYEKYTQNDINDVFENRCFISLQNMLGVSMLDSYSYYHGISFDTFDSSDVVIMSPNQVLSSNRYVFNPNSPNIVWIWLDNTFENRSRRFRDEHRRYDFDEIESLDSLNSGDFVKIIYPHNPSCHTLYFTNEVPERVAAIIFSIYKHPDLLQTFEQYFN